MQPWPSSPRPHALRLPACPQLPCRRYRSSTRTAARSRWRSQGSRASATWFPLGGATARPRLFMPSTLSSGTSTRRACSCTSRQQRGRDKGIEWSRHRGGPAPITVVSTRSTPRSLGELRHRAAVDERSRQRDVGVAARSPASTWRCIRRDTAPRGAETSSRSRRSSGR